MEKTGLDFFPFSSTNNQEIELLISRYGKAGHSIYVSILQKIYAEEGYYWTATQDMISLFAHRNNAKFELVSNIIEYLLARNHFDKDLYNKYSILTNTEIQVNYERATARRKIQFSNVNYLTSFVKQFLKNVNKITKNVNKNKEIDNNEKGKETKQNKTKLNKKENILVPLDKEFLEKFSSHLPSKKIDLEFVTEDTNQALKEQCDSIIKAIKESDFLMQANNITLSSIIKNKKAILEGKYKDYAKKENRNQNFVGRNISSDEAQKQITNLDEIDI